jgi:hypothetical protein
MRALINATASSGSDLASNERARVYAGGLTYGHLDDAEPGVEVEVGRYLVVGDYDADPGVAHVVEVRPNGVVLLRDLPGHADRHRQLLHPRTA